MDIFNEIYATLNAIPSLCDTIGIEKAMAFVRLAAQLKDSFLTAQPPSHEAEEAPDLISESIRAFLGSAIELPIEYIDGCWKAFGNFICRTTRTAGWYFSGGAIELGAGFEIKYYL
ncbi:hypothetical protein B0H11DRAFT_1915351 [Mycena galericulata]|nr:hypothetical protein B0H11DRAFT_1915801 [Mycena galericulata]KAJ7482067.1 hypothetical protein B0H11DRAFT_1915351 [Mycena galericulata]